MMCVVVYTCSKSSSLPSLLVDNVPMPWEQLEEFYPNAPPEEEDLGLTLLLQEADMLIDLTPYYQIAPHTFHRDGSAERAYELFRSLGLRYVILAYSCTSFIPMLKRNVRVRVVMRLNNTFTSITMIRRGFSYV